MSLGESLEFRFRFQGGVCGATTDPSGPALNSEIYRDEGLSHGPYQNTYTVGSKNDLFWDSPGDPGAKTLPSSVCAHVREVGYGFNPRSGS